MASRSGAWKYMVGACPLLLVACSSKPGAGDLVGTGTATQLTWASDDSEIFYIATDASGRQSVKAVKPDGSGQRVVDDSKTSYWSLAASPNALYVTTRETGSPERVVYELNSQRAITDLVLDGKADFMLAPSPDETLMLYATARSVFAFELATGSSTELASGHLPILQTAINSHLYDYSADGAQFFSVLEGGSVLIDLADRSAVMLPTATDFTWPSVHLVDTGPQILWWRGGTCYLEELGVAEPRELWTAPQGAITEGAPFTDDGAQVAVIDNQCTEASSITTCTHDESDIYVVDTASGEATLVASGAGSVGELAFSHDGSQLAYLLDGALRVTSVAP